MLNYEFPPIGGGAANAHLQLLNQYANHPEMQVDVLTSAPSPGRVQEQFAPNITLYKVGLHKKQLLYWRKSEVLEWLFKANGDYRRLIRDNDYDLAHAFFGFPTGWLCYRFRQKLPYIISLRGSDVPGNNQRLARDYRLLAGVFRRIWSHAAVVVANSAGLQGLANRFMPDLEIQVIPNGVDTDRFYPAPQTNLTPPLKLLTVGRLIHTKQVDVLISTVKELEKRNIHAILSIAGDGNLTHQLKQQALDLGLSDRINFLGRVAPDDIPALYRQNHLFITSSLHEGMSNATLEAMASGLPVITSNCEGVEELIKDNGIIVEPRTPDAFAQAVADLVQDPQLYQAMAQNSAKRAKTFSWSAVATQYIETYKKVQAR